MIPQRVINSKFEDDIPPGLFKLVVSNEGGIETDTNYFYGSFAPIPGIVSRILIKSIRATSKNLDLWLGQTTCIFGWYEKNSNKSVFVDFRIGPLFSLS